MTGFFNARYLTSARGSILTYVIALICVFKRLMVRAALFLWIMPLPAMLSITGIAKVSALLACSLSPVSIALSVFLIKVRTFER